MHRPPKFREVKTMLHVYKAISQLKKEVHSLEEGKVSVDKLIAEKQKQIEEFILLIEKVNENT